MTAFYTVIEIRVVATESTRKMGRMQFIRIALVVGVVALCVHLCGRGTSLESSGDESADRVSANGFVVMPPLNGGPADAIIVFAPKNCPSAAAQRADVMERSLTNRGIPTVRLDRADFDFAQVPDVAIMRRINTIVGGEMPVVFVNRRAKANPTLNDVLAEYRRSR